MLDSVDVQKNEFEDWGIMADAENVYTTHDREYQAMVLRAFNRFIEKGLVFRGHRPVFWSCQQ